MIRVEFRKDKKGNFLYLKLTGHSPGNLGKKGENLLCAGVSVLAQSLGLFFKKRNKLEFIHIRDGFLEFQLVKGSSDSNLGFELTLEGISDLQSQYPDSIEIYDIGE
ncbi:MAG: ribosomal-processing cysteine protease Prp [Leptospiraceae bacterium]|nr:ribosomal-processing cysteine protease Prp [Leptospiraceae bacterium]MCP5511295.1 ribosomal-processing cysteine protease Prp [Leptospiraceae bacterium]